MATITFDTHLFIKTLRNAGFTDQQAEAVSHAFKQAQTEAELATRTDLREMEYRLTLKLGSMMVAAVAVVAALVKLS
ncbi:MAG: DUF1640 domain-containing protein [Magnetococcales bacterium]|nr:DUF1640 domain-containing protein [Magnetococcales bacterium]